jgi:uncharacterized hydrophobic protein (TIGR00271 family)
VSQDDARGEAPGGRGLGSPPRLQSWFESGLRALLELANVSPARRAAVLESIVEGSQPTAIYYVLLGISELIAGFALIIGSDATLIGANVVAPLMTPIFGVALGLARGDLRLLRTALIAEFGGALVGVVLCFGLGLLPFALEPSAALLAQTRPTLIDLMVAALAGLAGALAMIDERVSPVLPGVAIATALNPPIAAIGLCLALGAYEGAWGAFLLFFANVLAILAVAGAMFVIAGFVTRAEIGSFRGLARRFAAAAIGLLFVTVLLTRHLVGMVEDLRTDRAIKETLDLELAQEPSTALESVEFDRDREGVEVLSTVRTPRVIPPERVKRMQDALSSRLGESVRLFVRCSLTKDVTATGSTNLRPYLSLNGRVTEAPLVPEMRLLQQAEQVAREVAATRPEIALLDVDLVSLPTGPVLIVSVQTPRDPEPGSVARFEALLHERLGDPKLRVVVRRVDSTDVTAKGRILYGAAHFGDVSDDEAKRRQVVEEAVRVRIQAVPNLFVTAIDAVRAGSGWSVRAEVVAPRVPTPEEVRAVEQGTAQSLGESVAISLRARAEVVVTGKRYEALGDVRSSDAGGAAGDEKVEPGRP